MSHITRSVNLGNTSLAVIQFVNYVAGGETFTLAEFGITGSLVSVYTISISKLGGLNQEFDLSLSGAVIKLLDRCSGDVIECPTTIGLNYVVVVVVNGT
jgi:hypothetical protein